MANIYVRSADGNDLDDGSTWALAKASVAGAAAIDAAGDTIWLSQDHAESLGAGQTWALAGTKASPTRVLCGNDAAEPPTALATTATVTTTGTNGFTITGECVYFYGITWNVATGAGSAGFNLNATAVAQARIELDRCNIVLVATGSGTQPNFGFDAANQGSEFVLRDVGFKFAGATQGIVVYNSIFRWIGGSLLAGTTSPNALFELIGSTGGRSAHVRIEDVDLSAGGSTMAIFTAPNACSTAIIRNCKLPAAWTGSLVTGTLVHSSRCEMYNCDSTDTNYRLWVEDYHGSIKSETTVVRTGGASDGTTSLSWVMASSANTLYPVLYLVSPEIVQWNDTVGSAKTVTVEILHDSVTNLQDDEIWLEVDYLGTAGFPLGTRVRDAAADVLTAAADQAASTATWTTTGLTNPNTQKLSVTFTPQEKGFFIARVMLAKASTTVYVDPLLTVA